MYECLLRLAMHKQIGKRELDICIKRRWITEEQRDEILRLVAERDKEEEKEKGEKGNE